MSDRVEGDRKRRVRISGGDVRVLQDLVEYGRVPWRYRMTAMKRLQGIIDRYKLMDESEKVAKGK